MVSSKQQNHTYLLHMRKWMLYIYLHAGLLCSSYLLLYGISALDFNHEFISDDIKNSTTTWTRTLILPDLRTTVNWRCTYVMNWVFPGGPCHGRSPVMKKTSESSDLLMVGKSGLRIFTCPGSSRRPRSPSTRLSMARLTLRPISTMYICIRGEPSSEC